MKMLESAFRGARFLDLVCAGWYKNVNTVILKMDDFKLCVLGQVYGHFFTGKSALGLGLDRSIWYGFATDWRSKEDNARSMADLTESWKTEIERRLSDDVSRETSDEYDKKEEELLCV